MYVLKIFGTSKVHNSHAYTSLYDLWYIVHILNVSWAHDKMIIGTLYTVRPKPRMTVITAKHGMVGTKHQLEKQRGQQKWVPPSSSWLASRLMTIHWTNKLYNLFLFYPIYLYNMVSVYLKFIWISMILC